MDYQYTVENEMTSIEFLRTYRIYLNMTEICKLIGIADSVMSLILNDRVTNKGYKRNLNQEQQTKLDNFIKTIKSSNEILINFNTHVIKL